MSDETTDLHADALVVGAGPAGIAAANELARHAVVVVVVDENQRPGGQLDRLRFDSHTDGSAANGGEPLDSAVTFLGQTVCHGFSDPHRVVVSRGDRGMTVRAGRVIIATGSHEVVYPLPGWTLPGVMTAGAAQTLLKGSAMLPYRRVVVAGTGPLLLAVACQLLDHGVEVAAVVDSSRPTLAKWRELARLGAAPELLGQGARYISRLARAGVRIGFGQGVRSIEGQHSVAGAWIAPVDRSWRFIDAQARFVDCDAVLLCHGFASVTELVAQAGGRIGWDEQRQGWTPVRDGTFRTTATDVRAVGDCAGVGGAQIARLEGVLAGGWAAVELGAVAEPGRGVNRLRRRLARLERFRSGMDHLFRAGPAVGSWAQPSTEVCRCEHVPRSTADRALSNGVEDLQGLKLWTRAGMGACQGRTCSAGLCALLESSGVPRSSIPPPSQRFPVRPVSVGALSDCVSPDSGKAEARS